MMRHSKKLILRSFYRLLGGIVRLGLRNGVTFKEFANISKLLYVRTAANEYGLQGRQTNMARIALITGLDRKDIKRVMDQPVDDDSLSPAPDRMSKILTAWYQDEEYLDQNGDPLEISIEGPSPSFTHLVKTHGGDVAVITVLREFKYARSVVEKNEGKVQALQPYYVPNYLLAADQSPQLAKPEAIDQGSSMLVDHINTIFHNLYREDIDAREKLDLRASNTAIHKDDVDEFYELVDAKGLAFLQEIDLWLSEHEMHRPSEKTERLGVGLYFIEGANNSEKSNV